MNASNYVIELLIAGICSFVWMIILLLIFIPEFELYILFDADSKLLISLILLPIIYIIGIIVDRLTDELFEYMFPLRKKYFNNLNDHREALSLVYLHSDTLTKLYEYGRMRIRVCRSWIANGTLILISTEIYIWTSGSVFSISQKPALSLFIFILLSFLITGAFVAWKKLNIKEFKFLLLQNDLLRKSLNIEVR
jgi:hypothetical protein